MFTFEPWNSIVSANFPGLTSAADDREAYHNRVARKEALSNWLAEAAKLRISQEVDTANFQVLNPT